MEISAPSSGKIQKINADVGDQRSGPKPGPGVDEPVNGTISSTIQRFRATGTNLAHSDLIGFSPCIVCKGNPINDNVHYHYLDARIARIKCG